MVAEATEMFSIDDEKHRRLVSIQELLDELRSVKTRLAKLEHWRDLNFEASPGKANRGGSKRPFENRPPLEIRPERLGRVGHGERANSLLADVAEEDSLPEQERDTEVASLDAIAAAASEHRLCAVAGD
jgi:hypothetical protein